MDDLHDHRAEEMRGRGRGQNLSSQSWTAAGHPKDSSYSDVGGRRGDRKESRKRLGRRAGRKEQPRS